MTSSATRPRHRLWCDQVLGYYRWRPTWRHFGRVIFVPSGPCDCGANEGHIRRLKGASTATKTPPPAATGGGSTPRLASDESDSHTTPATAAGTLSPLHIKPEDHVLRHEGMGNYLCSCGISTPGWPCPVLMASLLYDVANSGVEWGPDPRMSYVVAQIDSNTWDVLSWWRDDHHG